MSNTKKTTEADEYNIPVYQFKMDFYNKKLKCWKRLAKETAKTYATQSQRFTKYDLDRVGGYSAYGYVTLDPDFEKVKAAYKAKLEQYIEYHNKEIAKFREIISCLENQDLHVQK